MASQEVQHLFNETLALLLDHERLSPQVAIKRIETAIQLDRSQCDLWRALLFTDPSTHNAPKIIKAITSSISTFGQLTKTANDHYRLPLKPGDPNPISTLLSVKYPASLDAMIELSSPTRIMAAYALQLALEEGRYDDAKKQLEQVPHPNSPTVAVAWALIYWHTQRWADAKDWAEKLFRAVEYAPDDITPVVVGNNGIATDERAVALGYLIAGMAHAHFGNDEQATRWFDIVTQSQLPTFPAMNRAAYYTLGMMHRARGAFADAQSMFQSAKQYGTTPELDAAVADETIRLRRTSDETIDQRTSYWDVSTEPSLERINERRRAEAGVEILGAALARMDTQVGLTEVKAKVHTFASTQRMNEYWRQQGIVRDSQSRYNFVFQGPPGTGKTVTAEAFRDIMFGYGIIKQKKLVGKSAADLVGSVVGEAEKLTMAALQEAAGGVIFIDEVYELTQAGDGANGSNGNIYGKKVAETILKYMEDNEDCRVIIAGYKHETDQFIASNPGFKSRFTDYINFVSYTPDELGQIATLMASNRTPALTFGPGALERFVQRCAILMEDDPNSNRKLGDIAGNGRMVRNFVDKLIEQIDLRLSPLYEVGTQLTPEDASTVTVADVDGALDPILASLF